MDSTARRSCGVVTFSSRGSPSTAFTRPPRASTSDAQSDAEPTSPASAARSASATKGLRRLRRDEPVAHERLDDLIAFHPLDGVGDGERRHDPVPALAERLQHALDHLLRQQRTGRVVDEHSRRLDRHLRHAQTHRFGTRRAAGDGLRDLAGARAPRRAGSPAPPSLPGRRPRSRPPTPMRRAARGSPRGAAGREGAQTPSACPLRGDHRCLRRR